MGRTMQDLRSTLAIALLAGMLVQSAAAQSPSSSPAVTPETAFVSRTRYTNAFFGFSLQFPPDAPLLKDLPPLSRSPSRHWLFGVEFASPGLTVFMATANESKGKPDEEAGKAASVQADNVKRIEIGKRQFWKGESQKKSKAGTQRFVNFATYMDGYVVTFTIVSFDVKLAKRLENAVESMVFFDPAEAKDVAGPAQPPLCASPEIACHVKISAVPSGTCYPNST